jgi:hypothetical protein
MLKSTYKNKIHEVDKSRNNKTEDENKILEQLLDMKKSYQTEKEIDQDLLRELRPTNYFEGFNSNKGSSKNVPKVLTKKQYKALLESKNFSAIAKERKFKIYFQKKEEKEAEELLKSKTLGPKTKNKKWTPQKEDNGIFESFKINKLDSNKNQDTLTLDNILNSNEHSFCKTSNHKSNTFLTSYINLKPESTEQDIVNDEMRIYKKIFDNDMKEAKIYSSINMIPKTSLEEVIEVPNFYESRQQLGKKTATIDPNFFIKHEEKMKDKKSLINFNTNPSLIKRGFGKTFQVDKNFVKSQSGSEFYCVKKAKQKELSMRNFFNSKEINKKLENVSSSNINSNPNAITQMNSYFITQENSTSLVNNENFNKFAKTSIKSYSDYKDIIYNSKSKNFYEGLGYIREMIKNEMKTRANRICNLTKESKIKPEEIRARRYEQIIREIRETKEQLREGFYHAQDGVSKIHDSTGRGNQSEFILDEEEKNVLGFNSQNTFFNKTVDKEIQTFKRSFKKIKYGPQGIEKQQSALEFPQIKKTKFKIVSSLSTDHRSYDKKKNVENLNLNKRMKIQDQKLFSILNKIYTKDDLEKNIVKAANTNTNYYNI